MDGLEFKEIFLSDIDKRNRIDSEYYQEKYIKNEEILMSLPNFKIGEKYKVTDGEHGSAEYLESGVRYLTAENIKSGYVDISNVKYVSKEVDVRNARASVEVGDVLISIKGTLGEVAVAEEWLPPCNMNRDVAIIKAHDKDSEFSDYLAIFLMSKYGVTQSERGGSGGVQQMITLERLRTFIIPEFTKDFYSKIKEIYNRSQDCLTFAKKHFAEAEEILLNEMGLKNFQESQEKVAVKFLSESFGISGRIDAEYYQKKYDDLLNIIDSYSGGNVLLQELITSYSTGYPFDSSSYTSNGLKLIRITNIKKGRLDFSSCTYISKNDMILSPKDIVSENDIVISMSGTIGNCAKVPAGTEAIINQRILKLKVKGISPDVLCLIINSIVGLMQLDRVGTGGVQTNISSGDIFSIKIPLILETVQRCIESKLLESFTLEKESKVLLDKAKKAVEIAIEQGEEKAIKYI